MTPAHRPTSGAWPGWTSSSPAGEAGPCSRTRTRSRRSASAGCSHAGPVAHLILVCSGPGIFAGDRLEQRVRVERGARVLLVSQAAVQLHPAANAGRASLESWYEIEDDAALDCFWDPVIPFAGARLQQRVDLQIAAGGEIFWSDALMSGRVGRGETWRFAALGHELRANVAGSLVYLERYDLAPLSRAVTHPWRAHRANYLGTTIVRSAAATAGRAEEAQRRLGTIAGLQAGVDCVEPRFRRRTCDGGERAAIRVGAGRAARRLRTPGAAPHVRFASARASARRHYND